MRLLQIFAQSILLILAEATFFSSILLHQQHGPLHKGVKLLIADEKFNAELVWNETALVLLETSQHLQQSMDQMHSYGSIIEERLKQWSSIDRPESYGICLKQYEREIAHFNRELLRKYDVCLQTLNAAVEHLENESAAEIAFIRNATMEIQNVAGDCHTAALRLSSSDQAGITMCVASRIGQIDQRLLDSAQLILDVIAQVAIINSEDGDEDNDGSESCQEFNDIREEFDAVYTQFNVCNENGSSLM